MLDGETVSVAILVDVASFSLIIIGSCFLVIGAIGLWRMPDVFTRMHAASVIDTVGAGFLLLGLALQAGISLVTLKLGFVFLLLFFFGPVAAHALVQAALHQGLMPNLVEDGREEPVRGPETTEEG